MNFLKNINEDFSGAMDEYESASGLDSAVYTVGEYEAFICKTRADLEATARHISTFLGHDENMERPYSRINIIYSDRYFDMYTKKDNNVYVILGSTEVYFTTGDSTNSYVSDKMGRSMEFEDMDADLEKIVRIIQNAEIDFTDQEKASVTDEEITDYIVSATGDTLDPANIIRIALTTPGLRANAVIIILRLRRVAERSSSI